MTVDSGPNCIAAQLCKADFYYKFSDALNQCHGNSTPESIHRYQQMPFYEVVDILAQNGLRMVYSADWHMDHQLMVEYKRRNL